MRVVLLLIKLLVICHCFSMGGEDVVLMNFFFQAGLNFLTVVRNVELLESQTQKK